ncbi:MAG: hypothetical protein HY758_09655 [Nitrospirae bacterium]|nr:hypothetical protein [Nitrospirota bacterium]
MFKFRTKEIKRFGVIVGAMAKYGFGSVVTRLHLREKIPLMERILIRLKVLETELSPSKRLRKMFEDLGTTFIKLGQVLSLRRDILPDEYIIELEKLQDMVAPIPIETVKEAVRKELGRPVEELFAAFEERPLAAASIAQVHKAVLKDGREVVLKIQRPEIEELIRIDLDLLGYIARRIVKYIPESRLYDPEGQVEEVKKTILKELNFETEMGHARRFGENFAGSQDVYVPAVMSEFSSRRILTMEMSLGQKMSDIYGEDPLFKKAIAGKLVDSYLKQVFKDGFFHADPHPGNIIVLEDGRICFHDFGMMGYLHPDIRENLADWLLAFLDKDFDAVADVYLRIATFGEGFNRSTFKKDIGNFVEEYYNLPLKEFSFASIMEKAISTGRAHNISVPADFLLLGKAFMTVESMVRELDPEFNLVESIKPYAKALMKNKLSPFRLAKEGVKFLLDMQKVFKEAPKALEVFLNNVKEGKGGELKIKHEKLEDLENRIDRSSNRLAFAIVVASIIIGSSYIAQYRIGPQIWGFSALGIIGYTIAGLLGLRLVWAIIKSGRL